jgi:hypothetical protein
MMPGITSVTLDQSTTPEQIEINFDPNAVAQVDGTLPGGPQLPQRAAKGAAPYVDSAFSNLLTNLDACSDFELDQLASDGSVVNEIFGPDNPPAQENATWLNVAGTEEVQVAIPISGPALQPGNYQVAVEGLSTLAQDFDGLYPGSVWDALNSSYAPVPISTFTVHGLGASFQDALGLGTIGPTMLTIPGSLNPDDFRSAVDFYQFTLGPTPGNLWEVEIALGAQAIGSKLQADIVLFGADGTIQKAGLSGTGLPGDPGNPYLFAGLAPGTYYVGVSGAGYLPHAPANPNGYDPELGVPGILGFSQPGGPFPFQLNVVANPDPGRATVTGFLPNWADPLSKSPTSLTLDFSSPINLSNLFLVDQAEGSVELIDSSNRSWPITPDSYDVSRNELTTIIDEPLAAGTYRLVSPAGDPLTDQAGRTVVAPGEPAGVLATFTVAAQTGATSPEDLGVIWPEQIGAAPSSIGEVVSGSNELAPGQQVTFRFVAIVMGWYKLQTVVEGGSIAVQQLGPSSTNTLDAGSTARVNNYLMQLAPGVYQIRFVNVGAQGAHLSWRLKIASLDWEKILANGVGQASAVYLGLVAPTASDPNPGASATESFASIGVSPTATPSGGSFPGPAGPIPSNLLVTLDTGLMGLPPNAPSSIAPVGPAVVLDSVALADSASGLLPGIRYASMSWTRSGDEPEESAGATAAGWKARAKDAVIPSAESRPARELDPEADSILADQRALVQPSLLLSVAGIVRDWLGRRWSEAPVPSPRGLSPAPTDSQVRLANAALRHGQSRQNGPTESTVEADMQFPGGLVLVVIAACRLREPIGHLWRTRAVPTALPRAKGRPYYPKPHASSTFARKPTRVRR